MILMEFLDIFEIHSKTTTFMMSTLDANFIFIATYVCTSGANIVQRDHPGDAAYTTLLKLLGDFESLMA